MNTPEIKSLMYIEGEHERSRVIGLGEDNKLYEWQFNGGYWMKYWKEREVEVLPPLYQDAEG